MGRRNQGPPLAFDLSDTPPLPTAKRARLTGGRLISAHPTGGVWVYRRVPMEPMADARSRDALFASAAPLMTAYGEVANLSRTVGGRRGLSRSSYRETHLLWVNIPRFFHVTSEHSNAAYLNSAYHDTVVTQRLLLFGVRLVDSTNLRAGVGEMVRSLAEQWQTRSLPVSAFDADYATVDAALARAGLETPTSEEFRLADAWWNHGRAADTPILPHVDHLHVFEDASGLRLADQVGRSRCDSWPDVGVPATALTFASVSDFDLPFTDPAASAAMWACSLAVQGTAAVSVRGAVEPATATRSELRRNRKRYAEDIAERFKAGKMNKYEQDEHLANLQAVEELYATGGSPTLIDTSIVVAFDGQVADIEQLSRAVPGVELELLAKRQPNAWSEMLMTSSTRANPNLHDVPIQTIAHAGFQSLARVGDDPLTGTGTALLGFTENDRQPAWLGADAASLKDAYPLFIGAGGTGSGKTVLALSLAAQWARQGVPVVFVDPKTGSDHGPVVRAVGGQVASLDDLIEVDGVFDPIRFSARPIDGVQTAAAILSEINPWGGALGDTEQPLQVALAYGVNAGATCTGQALLLARDHGRASAEMVDKVLDYAAANPLFRAMVGVEPGNEGLRVTSKLTLIKVGNAHLDLPQPGGDPRSEPLSRRVVAALVRMMVHGAAMALTGRGGVVMLDEAWVFLGAGHSEVEKLGRLARSQRVLPMLFTQRVTDAVNAGLSGYISRGMILPLEEAEARAACQLFGLEPTAERIARITAPDTMGASGAPNWRSMKALYEGIGESRRLLRGTVGIYADLYNRVVPVEIKLPPDFLRLASTNAVDIARRDRAAGGEPPVGGGAATKGNDGCRP